MNNVKHLSTTTNSTLKKLRLLNPPNGLVGSVIAANVATRQISRLVTKPNVARIFPKPIIHQRLSRPFAVSTKPTQGNETKWAELKGNILIVGLGSIAKGSIPLLLRHIKMTPQQLRVVTLDTDAVGRKLQKDLGFPLDFNPLTPDNYVDYLSRHLKAGDFLLNLSVDVSSHDLMKWCAANGVLYLDTCLEPWLGGHMDASKSMSQRSNYAHRETAKALKKAGNPTAIITHGANPGMVSYLVKQGLLNIAKDTGVELKKEPTTQEEWARLAHELGIKTVHIAERDTQVGSTPKRPGEFVNTWSVDGFVSEGCHQAAEMGWGTHEKKLPADGHRHEFGCDAAIYIERPGASIRVRTWTPNAGPILGFLVTHSESISIADYFTLRDGNKVVYRPSVNYAYHPCDAAVLSMEEAAANNWHEPTVKRLMTDEIVSGMDELGVLLMGHKKGAYWFGSQLTIGEARKLAPYNNATSLQVTAPVVAGVAYAINNPKLSVVDPDELDHKQMLNMITPYLGNVVGKYTDWTPIAGRDWLWKEKVDKQDPWQFENFRMV